jgi:hypothetical protein
VLRLNICSDASLWLLHERSTQLFSDILNGGPISQLAFATFQNDLAITIPKYVFDFKQKARVIRN